MEMDFGSMKQNANYFYSMDTSKVTDCNYITSQPFIYVDDVDHIFFADVESYSNWKYVLQSHARKYMIFDNMVVLILDDGRHVTTVLVGENPPNESVEEEDIEEDNDHAQNTSSSFNGEADYVDITRR